MNNVPKKIFFKITILVTCICLNTCPDARCQTTKISKGDILEIRVFGHEEFSKTIMVLPNGTVDFPLASDIPIDGLTFDEFRELLKAQAMKYLGEVPIITVRLSQTIMVPVTVLGHVAVPGEYVVAKNATVQGAITRAGGILPKAQFDRIRLIRKHESGTDTLIVNLHQFYLRGDPGLLPLLEEGDIIVVPGLPSFYEVTVIGAVNKPGIYTIYTGATLLNALYMAGGPTEEAALNKVKLISSFGIETREIDIDIKNLIQANKFNDIPVLKAGDIIYVKDKKGILRSIVSFARDFTSFLVPIALIVYYLGRINK